MYFKNIVWVALLLGLTFCKSEHTCIYDDLEHRMVTSVQNHEMGHKRAIQPMRIRVDLSGLTNDNQACQNVGDQVPIGGGGSSACAPNGPTTGCMYSCTADDILTATKESLLTSGLLPEAIQWFQHSLSLRNPIAGNLTLQSTDCAGISVPSRYSLGSGGVADTDLVMFISARPVVRTTIAFASPCELDSFGRTIAGRLNFNPIQLVADPETYPEMLGVTVHEATHILGFRSESWDNFRDPNNNFQKLPYASVVSTTTQPDGTILRKLITPELLVRIREHFGCSTMDGGALEDGGGDGTALSHWEKSLFQNEFMTGTSSYNPARSKLTLAVLQDMGHYVVDYDYVDSYVWGKGQGCSMVNSNCTLWTPAQGGCTTGTNLCTYDRMAVGQCSRQSLMNFCPVVNAYSNGQCEWSSNTPVTNYYQETYGAGSRCLQSKIFPSQLEDPSTQDNAGCYRRACLRDGSVRVKVGDIWYTCDNSTMATHVEVATTDEGGGYFVCPPSYDIWCNSAVLVNDWPGFVSIEPDSGKTGDTVTVTGIHFNGDMRLSVGGVMATDVERVSNTTFTAKIGSYKSLSGLVTASTYIVIYDSQNRTQFVDHAFKLKNADVWRTVVDWLKVKWYYVVIPLGVVVACCVCVCLVKACKSKKKVHPNV